MSFQRGLDAILLSYKERVILFRFVGTEEWPLDRTRGQRCCQTVRPRRGGPDRQLKKRRDPRQRDLAEDTASKEPASEIETGHSSADQTALHGQSCSLRPVGGLQFRKDGADMKAGS